jgi:CRP/FNR family transcriptional regulator, cyclic AMP receptor protein
MTSPVPLGGRTFADLLTAAERSELSELGMHREFPSGALLMYEGEPGERVMLIEQGRVKVTRIEPGGHETLLSIRDPGDILGELSFFDGTDRVATVAALEPVRVLVVASSTFRAHLERTPRIAVALLWVLTSRFREATIKRSQFTAADTIGRLSARLLELSERYGARRDDGVEIELGLSQEELAAWTGASRAGVAKALHTLRELGWIETHRRRILVRELDALRDRAA